MYIVNRGDGGDTPCQEYKLDTLILQHGSLFIKFPGPGCRGKIKYCFVLLAQ